MPAIAFSQKSEVIVDSADSKAVIFSKSQLWVAKTWKSANDVVQMKDEVSGTIVVKGGLKALPKTWGVPGDGTTMTTVMIIAKDGKAKISFENTSFKWVSGPLWIVDESATGSKGKWSKDALAEMQALIADYRTSLTKKVDDF